MNVYHTILSEGVIYAQIYNPSASDRLGANFLSNPDSNLQISTGNYNREVGVPRHSHWPNDRHLLYTEEILIILSGAGYLKIFDDDRNILEEVTFQSSSIIHLLRGGHELVFTEPTKIIEVKQGPYLSPEMDKYLW